MIWKLLLVITMKPLCQLLMVHRIHRRFKNKFYEHHQWIESRMDEDYYDVLNTLPRYLEKQFVGKNVYLYIMKLKIKD